MLSPLVYRTSVLARDELAGSHSIRGSSMEEDVDDMITIHTNDSSLKINDPILLT